MNKFIFLFLCVFSASLFAYENSYDPYKPYSMTRSDYLENQLRDLEDFNRNEQHRITRGTIHKDQIGNGYTYRDSNGHGSRIYYDPICGGTTCVDSW